MMTIARLIYAQPPTDQSESNGYYDLRMTAGELDGSVRRPTTYTINGQVVDSQTWDRAIALLAIGDGLPRTTT